jgi:hypothetical protein
MKRPIIDPSRSYNFSDYFALNPPIDELLAYFGYSRKVQNCSWPKAAYNPNDFAALKEQLDEVMLYVDLTTEAARREILIAPILVALIRHFKMKAQIEYPIYVSEQLKGKLDYYLQRNHNLLIIEAKNEDLARGFTQLAVELIALDQWLDEDNQPLYGIITIGDAWRLAILDRFTKQLLQDVRLYVVPHDLHELLPILLAILGEKTM